MKFFLLGLDIRTYSYEICYFVGKSKKKYFEREKARWSMNGILLIQNNCISKKGEKNLTNKIERFCGLNVFITSVMIKVRRDLLSTTKTFQIEYPVNSYFLYEVI